MGGESPRGVDALAGTARGNGAPRGQQHDAPARAARAVEHEHEHGTHRECARRSCGLHSGDVRAAGPHGQRGGRGVVVAARGAAAGGRIGRVCGSRREALSSVKLVARAARLVMSVLANGRCVVEEEVD